MSDEQNHRTKADIVRDVLLLVFVAFIMFVWWFVMLLLASLFLLNVWNVTIDKIFEIAIIMMIVSTIGFAVLSSRKKLKKRWPR